MPDVLPGWTRTIHRSVTSPIGTTVLYTVPAGQKLYVTSAYLIVIPSASASTTNLQIQEELGVGFTTLLRALVPASGPTSPLLLTTGGIVFKAVSAATMQLLINTDVSACSAGFTGFLD